MHYIICISAVQGACANQCPASNAIPVLRQRHTPSSMFLRHLVASLNIFDLPYALLPQLILLSP